MADNNWRRALGRLLWLVELLLLIVPICLYYLYALLGFISISATDSDVPLATGVLLAAGVPLAAGLRVFFALFDGGRSLARVEQYWWNICYCAGCTSVASALALWAGSYSDDASVALAIMAAGVALLPPLLHALVVRRAHEW